MAEELSQVNVVLNADSAEYVRKLAQAQAQTKKDTRSMQNSFEQLSRKSASAGQTIVALSGSIVALAENARRNAIELQRSADTAGLSVQQFQSMALAVNTVGINTDQLGSILGDTEEKIGDFLATGGGGFQDFADVMGLTEEQARATAEQLQGLSGRDVLVEMVRQMEAAGISGERMNFALEGMASDSRYLLPLLRDNARELGTMEQRLGMMATTLEDDTVYQLNQLATVSTVVANNMQNTLAAALAGVSDYLLEAGQNAAFFWASLQQGTQQQILSDMASLRDEIDALNTEAKYLDNRGFDNIFQDDAKAAEEARQKAKELEKQYEALRKKYLQISGLTPPEPPAPTGGTGGTGGGGGTGGSGGSANEAGAATFGDMFGGTNTVDLYALEQYQETEALKTQYLQDALAIRDQLWIDNAETEAERLERQRQLELDSLDLRLAGTEEYKKKEAAINEKYRQQEKALDEAQQAAMLQGNLQNLDTIGEAFGLQFNLQKNFALAQALVDQPAAISAAWASAAFPANIPAVAAATLETASLIAQIKSTNFNQAHGGIDSVPPGLDNNTFLLKQGERVVQPDTNGELTEFLKAQKENGYQTQPTVVNQTNTFNNGGPDFANMVMNTLTKQPKQIAAVVEKGKKLRPNQRSR
ncbi:hypothetical protein ABXV18_27100 [Vibrio owensii]|uniref:hypothetical protein n=1 Tax=Vibrio owensii TaxID=696485 RepID=UPI0033925F2C